MDGFYLAGHQGKHVTVAFLSLEQVGAYGSVAKAREALHVDEIQPPCIIDGYYAGIPVDREVGHA